MVMLTLAVGAIITLLTSYASDKDHDGLDDYWESTNSSYGCSATRADMIVVCYSPSGKVLTDLGVEQKLCDRVYSSVGYNLDGSTGVRISWVRGGMYTGEEGEMSLGDFYKRKISNKLRGKAYVLRLGDEKGTGGQSDGYYPIAGCSYDAQTMAHELGHLLGLEHAPFGMESGQSPLYTSIMSYEFMPRFNGSATNVHFSSGKFASVNLDENRLNESLPFPERDLAFLRYPPYQFSVRAAGSNTTHVDWNRNGTLGESSVRANIDDGYAITPRDRSVIGKVAGKPTLLTSRNKLHVLYPVLGSTSMFSESTYPVWSLSRTYGSGKIVIRTAERDGYSRPITLMSYVEDDYTAIMHKAHIILATIVDGKVNVQKHADKGSFQLVASKKFTWPEVGQNPSLALIATNIDAWLVGWNSNSHDVFMRKIDSSSTRQEIGVGPSFSVRSGPRSTDAALKSEHAVGAGYNSNLSRIVLFTTQREGDIEGRIRHNTLGRASNDTWSVTDSRFVEGKGGGTATKSMPSVTYNADSRNGLGTGFILAYRQQEAERKETVMHISREVADRNTNDGWRKSLFFNEWNESRSAPSVLVFENELAFAFRWFGEGALAKTNNDLIVYRKASGIGNKIIADQNDIAHITTKGLKLRKER